MLRVRIAAVGRLAVRTPEAALIGNYLGRFAQAGRPMGLGPAEVVEVEDRKGGGKAAEASAPVSIRVTERERPLSAETLRGYI